jgi:3-oxoacyl-[acyl-carrier-protein] synthase III
MVDSLFKTKRYHNALVINAEFHSLSGGPHFPEFLRITSQDEVEYSFPSWTIGDAATATLLYPDDDGNFDFHFAAKSEHAELCTIPLEGYQSYCHPHEKIGKNGIAQFTSFGQELHQHAAIEAPSLIRRVKSARDVDILFVHSSSAREWNRYAESVSLGSKVFQTYPQYGNIVSASIPTAMHEAQKVGKLNRGMRVGTWIGSAGMSFAFSRFVY